MDGIYFINLLRTHTRRPQIFYCCMSCAHERTCDTVPLTQGIVRSDGKT